MTVREKLAQQEMFGVAMLRHGYAPFMRDYDIVAEAGGIEPATYLYRFTHCIQAHVTTVLSDEGWRELWDDLYTNYQRWTNADAPEGFVWGVCWSMAYPGLSYIDDSALAAKWSERLDKSMHEVTIETDAFHIQLIFHDVVIEKLSNQVSVIDKAIIPLGD